MIFSRRDVLRLAGSTAVTQLPLPAMAAQKGWPQHPLRWIVGFPAAGAADIVARLLGDWLSKRLDRPVIVENRTGSAGQIAAETVISAPADGYTLLLASTAHAINAVLQEKQPFDFVQDIAPVAGLVRVPLVLEAAPSFPPTSLEEFIDYARANSGKFNMASSGIGTAPHLAGELFKIMTGIS